MQHFTSAASLRVDVSLGRISCGLALLASTVGVAVGALASSAMASGDANNSSCGEFPGTEASPGFRSYLPDCRAYELVTRFEEGGREAGLDGLETGIGVPSAGGRAVDWEAVGACCQASSAALNLYQSTRRSDGWQTSALTPAPSRPLVGLFEEQVPVFWSSDLSQTIFSTPASYAAGDERPGNSRADDLYLRSPSGTLTWLSQGQVGNATAPDSATFDGATPDASEVVFSSVEALTPDATRLATLDPPPQYLYVRDLATETTSLVDVYGEGASEQLIGPDGATLGNGGPLEEGGAQPPTFAGTTTNAISDDGSKIFFESPPAEAHGLPEGAAAHLYVRDLDDDQTTALDDPTSSGSARYEGAAADGSLAFFTSDEALDGAPSADELYEFDTATKATIQISTGNSGSEPTDGIVGVSAISNDGSHVYFVDDSVLATNSGAHGRTAAKGQPNLYVYNTRTRATVFIATLAWLDVDDCNTTCGEGRPAVLVAEPDTDRPSVPTPDGSVLVFESSGDLTGENSSPASALTATARIGERTITVASTAGFLVGHTITIGTGAAEELDVVSAVEGATQLTLGDGLVGEHAAEAAVAEPNFEVYRYSEAGSSLVCISCTPIGVTPTASATLGDSGGGSYAPPEHAVAMSEDGSRIFFDSPDPLVPKAAESVEVPGLFGTSLEPPNVYEWEDGRVFLISDGSTAGSYLDGTTPSGEDVFFTTPSQLVPTQFGGGEDIYDARIGGGFPAPPASVVSCEGQECRTTTGPTAFLPIPASATVTGAGNPSQADALFAVAAITAAQRARLARGGRVTLIVSSSSAGTITLIATARLHGRQQRVLHASVALAKAGRAALTLRLSTAARVVVAKSGSLALRLEASDTASSAVKIADLALRATGGDAKAHA